MWIHVTTSAVRIKSYSVATKRLLACYPFISRPCLLTSHYPWPLRVIFLKHESDHITSYFRATITASNLRVKFRLLWWHINLLLSLILLNNTVPPTIITIATLAFFLFLWCSGSQSVTPGRVTSASPGNLLEMQIFGFNAWLTESGGLGVGPRNLVF